MQTQLRSELIGEIEKLEKRLDQLYSDAEKLRGFGKIDLAEKLEETEIKAVDREIINKYSEYTQSLEEDYGKRTLTLKDIFKMDLPEEKWVVEKLVPDLGITAISGVPGSYKSWLSVYVAKCLNNEVSLFNQFNTKKTSSLIIDLENSLRIIRDRLVLLNLDSKAKVYYWNGGFGINNEDDFKRLKEIIGKKKIGLVVFDSLVRIHNKDENDSRSMSQVLKCLKELTELNTSVIFIHHSRKQSFFNRGNAGESMRGSSDILAAIDSHLLLEKTKEGLKISQTKLRQDEPVKPFSLKIISGNRFDFEYQGEVEEPLDKLTQAREEVVRLLKEKEYTRQDLIGVLKDIVGSGTIDKALKGLIAEKVISRRVGANNAYAYQLRENEEE